MKNKSFQKFLIIIFSLVAGYWLVATNSFAQKELDDYLYQYEKYREIHNNFKAARDKFIQYQTLSAKKEAIEATNELLIKRAETLRTYFVILKYRIKTAPGVVSAKDKAELSSSLDKEVTWLASHKKEIEDLKNPTLDTLFEISDRLEDKNPQLKALSYQVLISILIGKERDLQGQSVAIANLLDDQIGKVKTASQTAILKQWLEEVKNENYLSQKKIESAEQKLLELKDEDDVAQMVKIFSFIQEELENSKYFLTRALGFQKEIFDKLLKYE